MNHTVVRLRHVFSGADEGHYSLPDPVEEARRAVQVLGAASVSRRSGNETEMAERLVEAATQGVLPREWEGDVRPSAAEAERQNATFQVLGMARVRAEDHLLATTLDSVDEIIEDHLRPKLNEAVAIVRPFASEAVDLPWGVPAKMFAPEYLPIVDGLARAAAIYAAVRRAQSVLRETSGAPDTEAYLFFGEFRSGIRTHWPTFRSQRQTAPPWGDREGPSRFAWVVANLADDLWMPTADEVDGAYRALVERARLRPSPIG